MSGQSVSGQLLGARLEPAGPLHAARRAGMVAMACAELSLAMSGKLAWPAAIVAIVATAAAVEWLPFRALTADKYVRWGTTVAALGASLLAALSVSHSIGSGDATEVVAPLRTALPLALVVIGGCHAATWRRLRDVQSGLLVAFGLIGMAAVFAATIPAGVVAMLGGPALLLGLRSVRWQRALEEAPAAAVLVAPYSGARRPGVAAAAAAVTAALLLSLVLPFSAGTSALNRWTASHGVGSGANSDTPGLSPSTGQASRNRGTPSYTGGPLDLRMRGDLPTTPLLRVDNPGPYRLWRSTVYARYNGASIWLPLVEPQQSGVPVSGTVTSPTAPVLTFSEHRLSTRDTAVYAPGDVKLLTSDVAGATAVNNGNGTMLLDPSVPTYSVEASIVPTVGESTGPLAAAAGSEAWTQLPATVPDRVLALGQSLAGQASDPRDAARSIETYLRANEKYTLDSPVPGRNQDAVDAFLFRDHVGFCEQFASAETILLRAVHIPARLVTGLAEGNDNGRGGLDFTAAQLHAWVEFWVPGTGWVSSDPTAGAVLASGSSVSSRIRNWVTKLLNAIPYGRFGVAALLLGVAVAVGMIVVRRRRRRPSPPAARRAMKYGPASEAYRRLQGRLAPRGEARLPQETLRDHAARLRADPALLDALGVVEDEIFAAAQPPAERSAEAAEHLDSRSPVATAERPAQRLGRRLGQVRRRP